MDPNLGLKHQSPLGAQAAGSISQAERSASNLKSHSCGISTSLSYSPLGTPNSAPKAAWKNAT